MHRPQSLAKAMMPTVRCPARSGAQIRAFKVRSESSGPRIRGAVVDDLRDPRSKIEAAKRESGNSGPEPSAKSLDDGSE